MVARRHEDNIFFWVLGMKLLENPKKKLINNNKSIRQGLFTYA